MRCLMAHRLQQGHVHLQRRVGQQPGDLGLGGDLGGHQVQDQDLQRADMLGRCPLPVHDKDVFLVQGNATSPKGGGSASPRFSIC